MTRLIIMFACRVVSIVCPFINRVACRVVLTIYPFNNRVHVSCRVNRVLYGSCSFLASWPI